jgi:2-polyprenyl-6-methoxyphenol hydroxylase-like FAD-dependent oxidoreductase
MADTLALGVEVENLRASDDGVIVECIDHPPQYFDLVICADGGHVKSFTWSNRGAAVYAGYVLWRGLCAAQAMPADAIPANTMSIANRGAQHFVAYPIPTYRGETAPAEQFINWGWYAPTAQDDAYALLQMAGRTLTPHALEKRALPAHWRSLLEPEIEAWPEWARAVIRTTTCEGAIAPHPVFELVPQILMDERIALVGDCAHLASPITGSGARMAYADALSLAEALRDTDSLAEALQYYSRLRLAAAVSVVTQGQRLGAAWR